MPARRLVSSFVIAGGLVVVFAGLTAVLGFTPVGIIASLAVVAALLYAGAVWFGAAHDIVSPRVLVFDRELRISGGPLTGESVVLQFPHAMREEIQRHCAAAIGGVHSHFICGDGGRQRVFDAAPVLSRQPSTICGVLVEGAAVATEHVTPDPALSAV